MADAPVADQRVIAEFNDYSGLVMAIRTRIEELGVPIGTLDEVAGLPTRYVSKILGPGRVRRFSMQSLTPILWTLGIKLQMVEDADTAHYELRLSRSQQAIRAGTVYVMLNRKKMREIQRLGGLNSRKYMSKRRATQLARKSIAVRWSRARERLHNGSVEWQSILKGFVFVVPGRNARN